MMNHIINTPHGAITMIFFLIIVAVLLLKVNSVLMNRVE
jgi:hypothetical protein